MPDEINTDNNGNIQNQPIVNFDQSNNKDKGALNHPIFSIETEKVSKDLNKDSKLSLIYELGLDINLHPIFY